MKAKLLLLWIVVFMWSCGQPVKNSDDNSAKVNSSEEPSFEAGGTGLTLNNGARWKADESTKNQVALLSNILDRFEGNENKSLESYLDCGKELQNGIEALVRGCTMRGADHDVLHIWLEPLMKHIDSLQNSADLEQAADNYNLVRKQVHLFADYFE